MTSPLDAGKHRVCFFLLHAKASLLMQQHHGKKDEKKRKTVLTVIMRANDIYTPWVIMIIIMIRWVFDVFLPCDSNDPVGTYSVNNV